MVFGPALLKPALPNEEKMVYYIYFDNQDIDTLERIANRCSDRCSEGNYRGVSSITYYYNGQLAEHLDFRIDRSKAIDDDIVYRLGRTNQTLTDSTFVMVFEKRPE